MLYNAIQLKDFQKRISEEEKQELRKKYEIESEDVVIMFSGRTIPQKGVKELITSFKNLKNLDKAKLLIAGSANYGEKIKTKYDYELEELARPIKDKIKITGYIDNKDLYKIHNISDIAIVPSLWEELFGLVVIEAMSSGLPLIVTKSGGIPEIVDNECAIVLEKDNNLIKNLTESIDELIEDANKRKNMGNHGRKIVEKYGMEKYLKNFYKVMEEIKKEEYNCQI